MSKSPSRMAVVKREEKEAKLAALLKPAMMITPPGSELCLLAQSTDSPAARAVAGLSTLLSAHGIGFRVLLTRLPAQPFLCGQMLGAERLLSDSRFHDAHELLVLGMRTAWIGDSMRRNPSGTDSYELHMADCPDTATTVALSFERLWAAGTPSLAQRRSDTAAVALAAQLSALPADGSTTVAMTRH